MCGLIKLWWNILTYITSFHITCHHPKIFENGTKKIIKRSFKYFQRWIYRKLSAFEP